MYDRKNARYSEKAGSRTLYAGIPIDSKAYQALKGALYGPSVIMSYWKTSTSSAYSQENTKKFKDKINLAR